MRYTNLLTLHGAAEYTGIAVHTLRRYRCSNSGPESFIVNGKVVYERDELDRWLAEQHRVTRRGGVSV